jgi:hypothetical protein
MSALPPKADIEPCTEMAIFSSWECARKGLAGEPTEEAQKAKLLPVMKK